MLSRACILSVLAVSCVYGGSFTPVPDEDLEVVALESAQNRLEGADIRLISNETSIRVVDVGGEWTYKFPASEEAWQALRREAQLLKLLQTSLLVTVPHYVLNETPPYAYYQPINGLTLTRTMYRGLSTRRKATLINDLTLFLLSMHTTPTTWVQSRGLPLWEPTSDWITALGKEIKVQINDEALTSFFDGVVAQYRSRNRTSCKLVISHGRLETNLHVEGTTGKLVGISGFDSAVLSTRTLDFDALFSIDEELARSVMVEYCRSLRIPEFFEELKLQRTLWLFADLVAAAKKEDSKAFAEILKKITHMMSVL